MVKILMLRPNVVDPATLEMTNMLWMKSLICSSFSVEKGITPINIYLKRLTVYGPDVKHKATEWYH